MSLNTRNMEICDEQRFEILPTPDKWCKRDKKEYKVIRLRNGLTACLISESPHKTSSEDVITDDKTNNEYKMATAALCVGAGSFHNPKEFQGLAHLVEHMVFMGSKKYRIDFRTYIKQNGCYWYNGETNSETTKFYFNCFEETFENCLDRFAQIFISPLMSKESIMQEIHAVEKEFLDAVSNDNVRANRLLLSLAEQSSHISQNFNYGNLISITSNRDIDALYKYVHEFHKKYYTADRMTLVLEAGLPLCVLEQYVIDKFSDIPSTNGLPVLNLGLLYSEMIFDTPQFKKIIYVKSNQSDFKVILTWMLPPQMDLYKSKPTEQIIYCVTSDDPDSLYEYLTDKLWASEDDDIFCNCNTSSNSIFSEFQIGLTLTKKGFKNLNKVIDVVFGYLNMLKNLLPDENLFKHQQKEIERDRDDKQGCYRTIDFLSAQMHIYPPKDYFTGNDLLIEYNPKELTNVLMYLIPEKMNVMILSSPIPNITYDQVERWFSTEYTMRDFCLKWMERWKSAKPKHQFALPICDGLFVPKASLPDESLSTNEDSSVKFPELVLDTPMVQLWHKKDSIFKSTAAYYNFYLLTPLAVKDTKSACLMDILLEMLLDAVIPGEALGFVEEDTSSYKNERKGITFSFSCFSKASVLRISTLMESLVKFCENPQKEVFMACKKSLNKKYDNEMKKCFLDNVLLMEVLVKPSFTDFEKNAVLEELQFEEMKEFCENFFKNMHVKVLVRGNVDVTCAKEVTNKLIEILNYKPIAAEQYPRIKIYEIPNGQHCIRLKSNDKENRMSIIKNYYQIGEATPQNRAIAEIIAALIEEILVDALRTKKQLAYSLSSELLEIYGNLILNITLKSNIYLEKINTIIDTFLFEQYNDFKSNGLDKFRQAKLKCLKYLNCPFRDLEEEIDYNWHAIIIGDHSSFNLVERTKALERLQSHELEKVWHDCLNVNENVAFKKISIQILSHIEQDSLQDSTNQFGTIDLHQQDNP